MQKTSIILWKVWEMYSVPVARSMQAIVIKRKILIINSIAKFWRLPTNYAIIINKDIFN